MPNDAPIDTEGPDIIPHGQRAKIISLEDILHLRGEGWSWNKIALYYGVSRRTIDRVRDPEGSVAEIASRPTPKARAAKDEFNPITDFIQRMKLGV